MISEDEKTPAIPLPSYPSQQQERDRRAVMRWFDETARRQALSDLATIHVVRRLREVAWDMLLLRGEP